MVKGSFILWSNLKTVVLMTGLWRPSSNTKTGRMAQTWILRKSKPHNNKPKGAGCSGCPDDPFCYVRWEQAPRQVYKSYKAGKYKAFDMESSDVTLLSNTPLRVGAAGEPTEMPAHHWQPLLQIAGKWTGYTHKWKVPANLPYRTFCMASVHSVHEMKRANAMGYRTYRVGPEPITKDEIMCPHYTHNVTCDQCKLCMGSAIKAKNIYAPAHGARKNKAKEIQCNT